jgi:hypothetical protein
MSVAGLPCLLCGLTSFRDLLRSGWISLAQTNILSIKVGTDTIIPYDASADNWIGWRVVR